MSCSAILCKHSTAGNSSRLKKELQLSLGFTGPKHCTADSVFMHRQLERRGAQAVAEIRT